MSTLRNILGVARYERIMLMRTTRFRALGLIGVAIPVGFGVVLAIAEAHGDMPGNASAFGASAFIPFYFFTYVQTVLVAFVAGNFRAADEKAQIDEVIAARPLSTAELVVGKYVGVLQAMIALSLCVVVLTLAIQAAKISVTHEPFLVAPYFGYFFLMMLPALIFMSALTFSLGALLRNQTAVALVAIAYVITVLFFLGTRYGGIFDFGAFFAPLFYSDMVGLGDISRVLEIRFFYLALAAALLGLAIARYPRLPQPGLGAKIGHGLALVGLLVAAGLFARMAQHDAATERFRTELFATQISHGDRPVASVLHYDLELELAKAGTPLAARASMQLLNDNEAALETLIFTLNPGLIVESVTGAGGAELPFEVEGSVVRIGLPLRPDEQATVTLAYAGDIDRDAFDLLRRGVRLEKWDGPLHRGDLTAWIRDDSVFLPPRARWYPVPGVDYGNEEGRPMFFSTARIEIDAPAGLEVITQGVPEPLGGEATGTGAATANYEGGADAEAERRGSEGAGGDAPVSAKAGGDDRAASAGGRSRSRWTVDTPVPVFSLNAGEYTVFETEAAGVTVAFYVHPLHVPMVMFFEDAREEIVALVDQVLVATAQETGLPYPYERLSVVEVPFLVQWYFEGWEESGGLTQPGVLMVEEDKLIGRSKSIARSVARTLNSERGRNQEPAQVKRDQVANAIFSLFLGGEGRDTGLFRSPLVQLWSFNRGFAGESSSLLARGMPVFMQEDLSAEIRSAMFQRGRGGGRGGRGGFSVVTRGDFEVTVQMGPGGPGGRRPIGQDATWDEMLAAMQQQSLTDMNPDADPDLYRSVLDAKGLTMFRMIQAVVGDDQFINTLESFGEASEFEDISLQDFERAVLPEGADESEVERENLSRLIGDWVHGTYVPGYTLTRTEAKKVDDGWGAVVYQVMVRIRNGEPGRGFVQVQLQGRGDEITKNVEIDGGQEVEVSMVIGVRPAFVTVEPFLAKNRRALRSPLRIPEDVEPGPPEEYVLLVTEEEATYTEIIVDNEDEGFSLPVRRVQRYLRPGLEGGSWAARDHQFAFGRYETNFRFKRGGDGAQPAVWTATIPHAGQYDVAYYFLPERLNGRNVFRGSAGAYRFTVTHAGETEELAVSTAHLQAGWNLLGRFTFEEGEQAVVEVSDLADGYIYADAVRWRYIDPENPNAVYDEGLLPWEFGGGRGGFPGGDRGGFGGRRGGDRPGGDQDR